MLDFDIPEPCVQPGLFSKAARESAGIGRNVIPVIWGSEGWSVNDLSPIFGEKPLTQRSRYTEIVAQVDTAHIFIFHHIIGRAWHQHLAIVQDIGAVNDFQCFPHVMVRDQNSDAPFPEIGHQVPDITHRDRIDPGKRFVQQQVFRICRQASGDFDPAALPARKSQRGRAAQMFDGKLGKQFFESFAPLVAIFLGDIQNRDDVVFYGKPAKDRHLLGQIADSQLGAAVHRQRRGIAPIDVHMPAFRKDQPRNRIERGGFARAVRAQQRHNLAPVQFHRKVADHHALAIGLAQVVHPQTGLSICNGKVRLGHAHSLLRTVFTRPCISAVLSARFRNISSAVMVLDSCTTITLPESFTVESAML